MSKTKKFPIPDKKKKDLKELFDAIDTDRNGTITFQDVMKVLRATGHPDLNEKAIMNEMQKMDTNNDNVVDFAELLDFCEEHGVADSKVIEGMIYDAFRVLDKDKSNAFERKELEEVMTKKGKDPLSKAEFEDFMKSIDVNNDGIISSKELKDFLMYA